MLRALRTLARPSNLRDLHPTDLENCVHDYSYISPILVGVSAEGSCLSLRSARVCPPKDLASGCGRLGFVLLLSMEEPDPRQGPSSPSPTSAAKAFRSLLASLPKKKATKAAKFVKRLEDIPEITLPPKGPIKVALSLADRAVVGQFTGLWPSPKSTNNWVARNWAVLIKNKVTSYFLGRGYFLFEFSKKEDKDLIFRNGPYFMGPKTLYLNKWTPDFDRVVDVPSAVLVWVMLPNLPIHCWNWESLKHIRNTLGKFIDKANNKDQYDCARICVEVDLEVGLPEAIKIRVGPWMHVQKLDYEQLPFKCRKCQVYRHFARDFPSKGVEEKGKEEGWNQAKIPKPSFKKNENVNARPPQTGPAQHPLMESQGNKFEILGFEIMNTEETEILKEFSPPKSISVPERSKGKMLEEEEETQESKESEEEGEIGDS